MAFEKSEDSMSVSGMAKKDDRDHDSERSVPTTLNDDDKELEALGYVPSFRREFSNLATVCAYLI